SLRGDPDLIRSAIENVVRNGLRHTPAQSEVEVRLDCTNGATSDAVICIRDRGPGIPPHELEKVFEPFYRLDDSRARGTGAAGLGLAIARRAVAVHGGKVTAHNVDGGGLQVELSFPLRSA